MARCYRDMRDGSLDSKVGCRLVYVLSAIRTTLETCDLERRIAALEESHEP